MLVGSIDGAVDAVPFVIDIRLQQSKQMGSTCQASTTDQTD
jgi:hypothetical protein